MLWNALLLSVREIRRNLLRSFLTILGIVIGVAAVITMVTLGNGATAQISQQIASLGSNLLIVLPGQRLGPGRDSSGAPRFRLSDVAAVREQVADVVAVSAQSSTSITAVVGNKNWSSMVTGTDNAWFTTGNWVMASGREFNEAELRGGRPVCVIGETVRRELFGAAADPLGASVRLKSLSCMVIGLLASKGQSMMGSDQDDLIVMPFATFQRRISGRQGNQDVGSMRVSFRDGADASKLQAEIRRLLRERRHLATSEDDNFSVLDTRQIADTLTGTTKVLTALLGAVAAVSLLVGGIGIMNIMLVSVTERTREIGIRLAIGALEREVLLQFLVEAVALSAFGGLLGITLAALAGFGLASLMGLPFAFDVGINLTAFLFSAAVGVLFGYVPARRAARLDPIEALRHE